MPSVVTHAYVGRFAPSPTGPLHAGSLVAALASWLDAQAQGGQWLVRLEDVDTTRCLPGMDTLILQQLSACGLHSDVPPVWQSQRGGLYQQALNQMIEKGLAYPCTCSRKAIEAVRHLQGQTNPRHGELIYPGTCRPRFDNPPRTLEKARPAGCAWRLRTDALTTSPLIHWHDRRLGSQQQNVSEAVGDFVLKRADGCFTYQLAVVVDDAALGITDVVRGEDLADNTARQIMLQQALGLPTSRYRHTPLVMGLNGEKLSKQNGAPSLDTRQPQAVLAALHQAARVLGLSAVTGNATDALTAWVVQWKSLCASFKC